MTACNKTMQHDAKVGARDSPASRSSAARSESVSRSAKRCFMMPWRSSGSKGGRPPPAVEAASCLCRWLWQHGTARMSGDPAARLKCQFLGWTIAFCLPLVQAAAARVKSLSESTVAFCNSLAQLFVSVGHAHNRRPTRCTFPMPFRLNFDSTDAKRSI